MLLPKISTYVDKEIDRQMRALRDLEPTSDEYGENLDRLTKLQKIRQEEKPDRVSSDVLVSAVTNLLGIAMILKHEQLDIITSKAMSFIKPRNL